MNKEFHRYIFNGAFATLIHYSVLIFNVEVIKFDSIGFSNAVAAIFGISASFIGSRFFVFKNKNNSLINQLTTFLVLYGLIATMHGLLLYWWTDVQGMNYHAGFVLATGLQVLLSYWGNKKLVFKSS